MLTNSRIAYHRHDHKRCINAALCRARELCDARKARLTPIRETVLKTIWASHRPLGAYDIVDQMSQSETSAPRILPPTVYRAIQFLLDQGLIHRLSSLNAYIGCPFPGNYHSDFFLICEQCGSTAECSDDQVDHAVKHAAGRADFQVGSKVIEIVGICPECQV
jgi:Fur family zinc uptake transcriptional regulator